MQNLNTYAKFSKLIQFKSRFAFSSKVYKNATEALKDIQTGSTILFGGFGLCGIPENAISTIAKLGPKNLTCVSNNAGSSEAGLVHLLNAGLVKRMISSYAGENHVLEKLYLTGGIELEFVPQGTLAEKCRAAAAGIPAYYTPTGVGTLVEFGGFPIRVAANGKPAVLSEPRQKAVFNGREYLMEPSLRGDYAIVRARYADTKGNLVFNKTARNYNADIAGAARITIAEAEEIVEAGAIPPDQVHVPGILVQRVFKGETFERRIEKLKLRQEGPAPVGKKGKDDVREKIAKRASKEVKDGMYVNLGIGMPTLVPSFLEPGMNVEYQSENGVIGVGDYPRKGEEDPDLINAGKETITTTPGASFFSSSLSFGIIRGRHLNLTILGGMQVSATGDLANWIIPGKMVKGMGGAMDLVSSGSKVVVIMEHTAKGTHKILQQCELPLTGKGVVSTLITEQAVFNFNNGEMILAEIAQGYTLEDIRRNTGAQFRVADNLGTF